jgi:hypothetical protein
MRARFLGIVTLVGWVAALSGGCDRTEPRTQVMLVVDADMKVRGLATDLDVKVESTPVGAATDGTTFQESFPLTPAEATNWPFSFALVPRGGDRGRTYRITVRALAVAKPIAVLRAESGFVAGKTIALELRFEESCLNDASLKCLDSDTCEKGNCVAASRDQNMLPVFVGTKPIEELPLIDGGTTDPTGMITSPVMPIGGSGGAAASGGTSAAGRGGAGTAGVSEPAVPGDCGDGKLSGDEQCDTAIAAGQGGACPTSCIPATACEPTLLEGSGCHAVCAPHPITALESGDGCCPMGADGNSDTDCLSQCGNGTIEMGETCDPIETCPNAETCVSANACLKAVVIGDPTACNSTCTMQPILDCVAGDGCCPASCSRTNDSDCSANCGDGVVDRAAGELCEATGTPACITSCNDGNACTIDLATGSAANCNSACTEIAILFPFNGDGCCPPGANANTDGDCAPVCGNRAVERGERCDGMCPTMNDCNDGNSCTRDALTGTGCTVLCTHTSITIASRASDGCCPAGANANTDADCQPVCGNGERESGEACDGTCPTADTCTSDPASCMSAVFMGSGCGRVCTRGAIGPSGATLDTCCPTSATPSSDHDCRGCGNGIKEGDEVCDGANCPECADDNDACTRDHVTNNPDACHPKCNHDPIANCCPAGKEMFEDPDCPARCGNGHTESGELCDGSDCPPCDDMDRCTRDVPDTTNACRPTCTNIPITGAEDPTCGPDAGLPP